MEKKDRVELLLQKYCRSNLFSASDRRFLSSEIIRVIDSDDDVETMLSPRFNSKLQSKPKKEAKEEVKEEVKVEEKSDEKPKKEVKKEVKKAVPKPKQKKRQVKKKTHKKESPLKGFGKRKKANTLR